MINGNKPLTLFRILLLILLLITFTNVSMAQTVNLSSMKDNTLYEDTTGGISNGAGKYFFTAKTAQGLIRRGLIAFDVSSIPKCATITSVALTLHMSRSISGDKNVELRKVFENWGEGSSAPFGEEGSGTVASSGDATWLHRYHDTALWTRQGEHFQVHPAQAQWLVQ